MRDAAFVQARVGRRVISSAPARSAVIETLFRNARSVWTTSSAAAARYHRSLHYRLCLEQMNTHSIALFVAACALLLLGLFFVIPVAVNWPDSWFGGVLIAVLLVVSALLCRKAVQILRRKGHTTPI